MVAHVSCYLVTSLPRPAAIVRSIETVLLLLPGKYLSPLFYAKTGKVRGKSQDRV